MPVISKGLLVAAKSRTFARLILFRSLLWVWMCLTQVTWSLRRPSVGLLTSEGRPYDSQALERTIASPDFVIFEQPCHEYASLVEWNIRAIAMNSIDWLNNSTSCHRGQTPPIFSYSRSWLFSSEKAESLLSHVVPSRTCKMLRILMERTTLMQSWGSTTSLPHWSSTQLHDLRAFSGKEVLQSLEDAMYPLRLADCALSSFTGLFLLLFATMVAVSYQLPNVSISRDVSY